MLVLLTSVFSCKKYLTNDPVSSFAPEYVFSDVVNAQKAVLGAYACLAGDQGYGIRISMYYSYDDDLMMGQGSTPYPDNERRDIAHYNVTASNTQLAAPFLQLYAGVERANLCIYYIPKMALYSSGSEQQKKDLKRLHGEALTLRAQFYLELLRNWGDLPAQYEPAFQVADLYQPKTDRDSIYNHLLDDLALAETLVPWRTEVSKDERITQGAVRGLRARIALFRGGYSLRRASSSYGQTMARPADYKTYYQIAKDECAAIMQREDQHKLNSSFRSVFKDAICAKAIEPNGEVLFEVSMDGGTSALGDSKLGYYNGPRTNSKGNAALTVLPSYFYMYDSTDTRRDVMIAPYDLSATLTYTGRAGQSLVDGKFRRDWILSGTDLVNSAAQYFGVNWPILRYSDVLLMYAEADNELGGAPSATAIAALEKVRTRAYGGNASLIGTTPTDYTGFFNAIVKERALELGGEGIRKYDLIRWNLLSTRLAAVKTQLTAMAGRAAPWNNYPAKMYYKTASTSLLWAGSFYDAGSSTTPSGYTSVNWLSPSITTTISTYYAIAFQNNHSELLPIPQTVLDSYSGILKQDYGY
ncbi:outer membrane protein, nutrient binding [Filimonas lacunae]|nr:outer membrane protein, nutrient binding [Filimonas lacunae]